MYIFYSPHTVLKAHLDESVQCNDAMHADYEYGETEIVQCFLDMVDHLSKFLLNVAYKLYE